MADRIDPWSDPATMAHLTALLPELLHPTLVEMVEQMYLHLVEDAEVVALLDLPRLAAIAVGQLDRVTLRCGGSQFYMPKGIAQRLSARDMEIVRRHNGSNKRQLAREYDLSDVRIDQILNAWRRAEFERRRANSASASEPAQQLDLRL